MKKALFSLLFLFVSTMYFTSCQNKTSNNIVTTTPSSTTVKSSPPNTVEITTIIPTTEQPTTESPTEPPTEASTEAIERELYNGNNIRIIYTGFDSNSWISRKVKFRVENNSDKDYTIQVRDVSVNGFMMEPICSCDVLSGMKANHEITFRNSVLKENGIEKIDHIEFKFHIYHTYKDYFDTDVIKIDI